LNLIDTATDQNVQNRIVKRDSLGKFTVSDVHSTNSSIETNFSTKLNINAPEFSGNAATATNLNTTENGFVKATNGDGTLTFGDLLSSDIPATIAADTTGNAETATNLNTTENGFVKATNGDGTLAFGDLLSSDIPATIAADTTGNAETATNLNTTENGFVKATNGDGTLTFGDLLSSDIPATIAADTTGNAETATTAETATSLNTTDNGFVKTTNSDGTLIFGDLQSSDIPATIDANTNGNAATSTTATTAATATKLSIRGGQHRNDPSDSSILQIQFTGESSWINAEDGICYYDNTDVDTNNHFLCIIYNNNIYKLELVST